MSASKPTRNPRIVHTHLSDGQALLLHLESGAYHELNSLGAVIWELLDEERSASELASLLRARLDDPPQGLEGVVAGFLDELRERDLIT